MSKLGIKIILSYVAMAAISTIVFTVVIRTIMLDSVIFGEEVDERTQMAFSSAIYAGFLFTTLLSLITALIFEINIVGPVATIRTNIKNISLEKEMDWKKVKSKDELEDINKELLYMLKKLRDANKNQKEFFQNTSHELKTPLMSIQGYAEAIKDGVMEEDEMQNALDIIIEESKGLSNVITSVLYLSSMDKVEKYDDKKDSWINIDERIERWKSLSENILADKNIEVVDNVPVNLEIFMMQEKVDKLINNLLGNAIRYAKTKVEIDFFVQSNKAHLLISDDGNGFDDSDVDKIFDRFYKGEGGKNGLGLAIVKAIVDNYKGQIRAYNKEEGGAVVEMVFDDSLVNISQL
ncbi:ATPase/histidine kinase/DNA gyrase B/HSP90 domain protein [[Eubacterium] yurii subsp. margaretiae ATCC 43715]|nr:ATPase/histidine kinase/DNA gyrase B/HSP90 domain protein [[Eubacterium] yurii subsp. margaretiae ATCC 43715]